MKETTIRIEFPDKYSADEIVNAILSQVDVKSFNNLGINFFTPKDYNWFN